MELIPYPWTLMVEALNTRKRIRKDKNIPVMAACSFLVFVFFFVRSADCQINIHGSSCIFTYLFLFNSIWWKKGGCSIEAHMFEWMFPQIKACFIYIPLKTLYITFFFILNCPPFGKLFGSLFIVFFSFLENLIQLPNF